MTALDNHLKVSILIPNRNHRELIEPCVNSILDLSTYNNYEVVIIENGSTDDTIFTYYNEVTKNDNVRILDYSKKYKNQEFNYQKAINYGAANIDADYFVQLNNDTVLITPNWLELMLESIQSKDAGAVGAALYYPDMSLQHLGGYIYVQDNELYFGHICLNLPMEMQDEIEEASNLHEVPWVTGACLMMEKSFFLKIGGMDEDFILSFGDVDLCMNIRNHKKSVIIQPLVKLIHNESSTIGREELAAEGQKLGKAHFIKKWSDKLCFIDISNKITNEMRNVGLLSLRTTNVLAARLNLSKAQHDNTLTLLGDMTQQRDDLNNQINAIYDSESWKIGWRITRFVNFILRR